MALVMPKSLIFFFWPGEGGIDPNHKMLRTLFGCGKHPVFVPLQKLPSCFMFCLGILIITRGVFWGSSATYSFCYVNLLFERQVGLLARDNSLHGICNAQCGEPCSLVGDCLVGGRSWSSYSPLPATITRVLQFECIYVLGTETAFALHGQGCLVPHM